MNRRLMLGALAAMLVSCDSLKLRPYKEQGEAKLAALEAVHAKLASMPKLTTDTATPIAIRTSDYSGKRNAVVMHLEEIPSPAVRPPIPLRVIQGEDFHWIQATQMLRGGPLSNTTDSEIKSAFERFFAIERVVVVKVLSVVPPKLTGADTFEPGSAEGEAHVFTIAGAVHHGGVRFSAKSSPKVEARVMKSDDDLLKDLGSNALSALSRALQKRNPDYK